MTNTTDEQQTDRKASDMLLSIESKLEQLFGIISSQNLVINILSNKLNAVMTSLQQINTTSITPTITAEAISGIPNKIKISSQNTIPVENNPKGFRRNSRPETHENIPITPPKNDHVLDIRVQTSAPVLEEKNKIESKLPEQANNKIPVIQKVIGKNSKPVFMADVEIFDKKNNKSVFKNRTNAVGKWQCSLPQGEYKVLINKRESLMADKIDHIQSFVIDGAVSQLELPPLNLS